MALLTVVLPHALEEVMDDAEREGAIQRGETSLVETASAK